MSYTYFNQRTVLNEVKCEGVGLHSGNRVTMRLKPAAPDFGIQFRRMDVCDRPTIPAVHKRVVDTFLATSIGFDGVVVATIEHLMAALMGRGVDNVLIELDGPEVPIFDGSAAHYLRVLNEAGIREQNAPRQHLRIDRNVLVMDGDAYIKATPSDIFRIRYTIDFPHPLVGRQELTWSFSENAFDCEISRARTFGFLKDVEKLQSMGLARGGSLANAVVFDERSVLNQEGFRYANECVRHKILDFIGDLALAGMPPQGSFEVYKAGHALHNRFLKKLLADSKACSAATLHPACVPLYPVPAAAGYAGAFTAISKPLQ
ncbi:MAG: UDP-3-O-acyl-N-acetylglucosamine deacetylase [Syntrophobacteraceae bacterium]|nr:UDP-3-O-acyl-N-acetylglucosamine deacetylase [Desulfobacteraceae bacterium]